MTFEEFKNFYEQKGFCPNDLFHSKRKNSLNDKQLESRFKDYEKSENKKLEAKKRHSKKANEKVIEKDLEWEKLLKIVHERDGNTCQLISKLQYCDLKILQENSGGLHRILDGAHILSRSTHPDLKYDPYNVILLNRASHSLLDSFHDPITGKSITEEEQTEWWIWIVGKSRYEYLLKKSKY